LCSPAACPARRSGGDEVTAASSPAQRIPSAPLERRRRTELRPRRGDAAGPGGDLEQQRGDAARRRSSTPAANWGQPDRAGRLGSTDADLPLLPPVPAPTAAKKQGRRDAAFRPPATGEAGEGCGSRGGASRRPRAHASRRRVGGNPQRERALRSAGPAPRWPPGGFGVARRGLGVAWRGLAGGIRGDDGERDPRRRRAELHVLEQGCSKMQGQRLVDASRVGPHGRSSGPSSGRRDGLSVTEPGAPSLPPLPGAPLLLLTRTPADAEGCGDGDAGGRRARREGRGDDDAADGDAGASSASICWRAVVGKVAPPL
jgi:hypothetical protein